MSTINLYCDESCHLENDSMPFMVLGCVGCPKDKLSEINKRIKNIKEKYNVKKDSEIKWSKVSNTKIELYKEIVNYFFDDDDLFFRAVVAPKSDLDYERFNETHDDWYYKMYFCTIAFILDPSNKYNVYLDIKDTNSYRKIEILHKYLDDDSYDLSHNTLINNMQPIRSHEVQIMQITDILIGALSYNARKLDGNKGKIELIKLIKDRSNYSLNKTTPAFEHKFNVLMWRPK